MKIPFADLFRKSKARLAPVPKAKVEAPLPSAKKAESDKLAKTVLPSSTRGATQTEQTEGAGAGTPIPTQTARVAVPVEMSGETRAGRTGETGVGQRSKISIGATLPVPRPHLPPAVAIALEPNIERAIALPLADVIGQIPEGYLKPRESFDVNRPVLLRAVEVEKGMATGEPAVPVAAVYQQVPDIFMHTVPSSDGSMVALPFERVLDALSKLALRTDQAAEQTVPQVETPFLQVTIEDTKRFGTPMPAMPPPNPAAKTTELPSVRIEPATAEAFAAAVPEATDAFVPAERGAETEEEEPPLPSAPGPAGARATMRIPFTPTATPGGAESQEFGTGEPAFPRVPASSGPPVPPAPPAISEPVLPDVPARIPFNFSGPSDESRKHLINEGEKKDEGSKPNRETVEQKSNSTIGYNEPVLTLALRQILQHLPPMQLGGNPATVPSEIKVSFPMSMIAPQLASGKVAVKPNAFYAALPEEYRRLFLPGAIDAPVQLPLVDVLASLPGEALRIRQDQEMHTPDEVFDTPFAAKAAEDAARLGQGAATPKSEPPKPETPVATPAAQSCAAAEPNVAAPKFDAKRAVAEASALDGVESCSVIFTDGLNIAGNIPDSLQVDGLSAMAPTLLQKLEKHMRQTSLGPMLGMSVHGESASLSFFASGNVCLTALHSGPELRAESRRELGRITEELSRAYPSSESTHVHH